MRRHTTKLLYIGLLIAAVLLVLALVLLPDNRGVAADEKGGAIPVASSPDAV